MNDDPVARLMAGLADRQIGYLRFELPDLHGISRSKTVPTDKVEGYARRGLNFYGGVLGLDTRSNVVPGCTATRSLPTRCSFPTQTRCASSPGFPPQPV